MATSELLKAALIGLNIAGLSYGSAKRKEANEAIDAQKRSDANAVAKAEQTMHTWMSVPGGAPFKVEGATKIPPNAQIFATRIGTGNIKYPDPKIEQTQMFRHPQFGVGSRKEIEKSAVASGQGSTFMWDKSGAELTGFENFNPKTGARTFTELPASMRSKEDAGGDRYVTFGRVNDKRVYAQNPAAFEKKYKVKPTGSIAMPRAFVAGLNSAGATIDFDALSEKQANIFPEEKSDTEIARRVHAAKLTVDGKPQYFHDDNLESLMDKIAKLTTAKGEAVKLESIGETQFTGDVRTGEYNFPESKTSPAQVMQYVQAYDVDDNGNKTGGTRQVSLSDFRKANKEGTPTLMSDDEYAYFFEENSRGQLIPKQGPKLNPKTSTVATMKTAMDKTLSVKFIEASKDVYAKDNYDLFIPKELRPDPVSQRNALSKWLINLPRSDQDGQIDWKGLGYIDARNKATPRLKELVSYGMNLVEQLSAPKDDALSTPDSAQRALFANADFFAKRFSALNLVPGLRESLQMRTGVKRYKIKEDILLGGTLTDVGTPGQNLIIEQTDVPIAAQRQNPANSLADEPIPATIFQGVQLGSQKYGPTIKLASTLLATDDTEESRSKIESSIASDLVQYQRGPNGELVRDSKKTLVASQVQPSLNFLKELTETKDLNGDPMFMTYVSMVRGDTNLNVDIVNDIKTKFRRTVGNNYDYAHKLVGIATPEVEGTARSQYLWQRQTNKSEQKWDSVQDGWLSQSTAAGVSENFIDAALATFKRKDGTVIPIGTALGQWVVAADGFMYVTQQAAAHIPFIKDLVNVAPTQVTDLMNNKLNEFRSILDVLPESELRQMAEEKGKTYEQFLIDEKAAAASNRALWQDTVISNSGPSETVSQLSMRNYYRYMIAYTVASAIQGGTGGRTISDQDVQNILNAMKMDTKFTRPENEMKILLAMKRNMQRIKKHYGNLAAGGKRRYASLVMQDFDLAPSTNSLLIASEIEQPDGESANTPPANQSIGTILAGMEDESKVKALKSINNARKFTGTLFDTLAEAQEELGDSAFFESIKSFAKPN